MKVVWRNDALCLKPETELERQSLAAIVLNSPCEQIRLPSFTGEEPELQLRGVEH